MSVMISPKVAKGVEFVISERSGRLRADCDSFENVRDTMN